MRRKILFSAITILSFVTSAKSQDTLVSAFFGLDNGLPSLLCGTPGSQLDGMPVNFMFPIDGSTLSESDFEVLHTGYSEAPRYFKGTHHPYRSEPTSLSLCHFCMFKDVLVDFENMYLVTD